MNKLGYKVFRIISAMIVVVIGLVTIIGSGGGSYFYISWGEGDEVEVDDIPPTAPTNLQAEAISPGSIELEWNASTDNSGYVNYLVYRDGNFLDDKTSWNNTYTDRYLNPVTEYCYSVIAEDPSGNQSDHSNTICITTPEDIEIPSTPQKLRLSNITSSDAQEGVRLDWEKSTDNSTLAGYNIYRDNVLLESTYQNIGYRDYSNSPDTAHCYAVTAYDAGGNESTFSNTICSAGFWTLDTIMNGSSLQYQSIDIDSGNHVHVSFLYNDASADTGYIHYANNISGNWSSSIIGTSPYGSTCSALTVDAADIVHMIYCTTFDGLRYTNSNTIDWNSDLIDDIFIRPPSMGTDANQHIHLAYMQGNVVTYTTNTSGGWVSIPVMNIEVYSAFSPALAVDALGFVHISFREYINNDLIYATNRSGLWTTEIVDSSGSVGEYSSIAVDASQNVHISYYDYTNRSLKYATNTPGFWSKHIIDDTGYSDFESSIAIDGENYVHIAHLQAGDLLYTNNLSGDWLTYSIDNQQGSRTQPSIALDFDGNPHISYVYEGAVNESGIRYATAQ